MLFLPKRIALIDKISVLALNIDEHFLSFFLICFVQDVDSSKFQTVEIPLLKQLLSDVVLNILLEVLFLVV